MHHNAGSGEAIAMLCYLIKIPQMKQTLRALLLLALGGSLLTYSGCKHGGGSTEPITDQQIDKLNGKTFTVTAVTLGTVDKIADGTYSNTTPMTIAFTGGAHGSLTINYACSNRPAVSVWKSTGTMTLDATNPQTLMTRDDQIPITYLLTTSTTAPITTTLQMNFQFSSSTGYTRTTDVSGQWSFTLTAN
jgi:hypothetical protein